MSDALRTVALGDRLAGIRSIAQGAGVVGRIAWGWVADAGLGPRRTLTLLAQAQAAQGKSAEAEATYREAMNAATTEEPRVRYAGLLLEQGRRQEAATLLEAVAKTEARATPLYKRQEREWFQMAAGLRRELR